MQSALQASSAPAPTSQAAQTPSATRPLVTFSLGGAAFALPLEQVLRSVRAVTITPLPQAPEIICGIVNLQGGILPVVNLRQRLGMVEHELALSDQLLIAQSATRRLAIIVDAVNGVADYPLQDFIAIDTVVGGTRYVSGVVKAPDGMMLIHDLDRLLSLEEEAGLEAALFPAH